MRVWSNWKPERGPRAIVKALTPGERACLQRREFALECGLLPALPNEADIIDAALHGLFSGMPFAEGRSAQITRAVLAPYPAWAIIAVCLQISRGEAPGITPGKVPADAQIAVAVRELLAPYRVSLANVKALLAAPVEPVEEVRARPVAQLPPKAAPEGPPNDGKHALRVAVDIEARRRPSAATS